MCLPEGNAPAHRTLVSADHLSDSSAAEATMILNVELGGYWACTARLVSGCRVSGAICSHRGGGRPRGRAMGGWGGVLGITVTYPFLGARPEFRPDLSPHAS